MSQSVTQIDTGKVQGRRVLRFTSSAELFRDVDQLVAAERAGKLTHLGNWTLGQTLGHLASWISYGFDGYPPNLKTPWWLRLLMKFMKNKFMNSPLPAGFKISGIEGGTLGTDPLSTDEGLTRLKAAWARLDAGPPAKPNPVFGQLTHMEWKKLHLNHAALHLGFHKPA